MPQTQTQAKTSSPFHLAGDKEHFVTDDDLTALNADYIFQINHDKIGCFLNVT